MQKDYSGKDARYSLYVYQHVLSYLKKKQLQNKYLRHLIRLQGSVSISPVLRLTLEWVPSSSSQLPEHSDHSENSAENIG